MSIPKISRIANEDFPVVSENVIIMELISSIYTASKVKWLKSNSSSEKGFRIMSKLTAIVAINIVRKFFGEINYENSFFIEFWNLVETRTRSMVCSRVISVPLRGFDLKN